MKPVCNFEMAELPGFGLQKPITMRVIACFHEQPPIDSFEKIKNAVFPSAATIFRHRNGDELSISQSSSALDPQKKNTYRKELSNERKRSQY